MNMLVSTAIAGTAVPAAAVEPDPIFAAIEAHKGRPRRNESRNRPIRGFRTAVAGLRTVRDSEPS